MMVNKVLVILLKVTIDLIIKMNLLMMIKLNHNKIEKLIKINNYY